MSEKEKIIKGILGLAESKYPNSELYLFGSQTSNKSSEFSDWDLLMLLDSEMVSLEKEIAIMDDFYELELQTGAVISPIVYSKKVWGSTRSYTPIFSRIKKEGIRIK